MRVGSGTHDEASTTSPHGSRPLTRPRRSRRARQREIGGLRFPNGRLSGKEVGVRVIINGEERQIPSQATLTELVGALGLTGPVAIELNREIVPRSEHGTVRVADGDRLEIVHFVGGG